MNIVVVYRPWWPPLTPLRSPPSLPSLLEDSAAWRGHLFDVILKAETVSLSPQALNLSSSYSSRSKSSHETEPIKSGTSTVLIAKQSIGGLHRMVQLLDFYGFQLYQAPQRPDSISDRMWRCSKPKNGKLSDWTKAIKSRSKHFGN